MKKILVALAASVMLIGVATPAEAQDYACTVDVSIPATAVAGQSYTVTFTPETNCAGFVTTDVGSIYGALANKQGKRLSGAWDWSSTINVTTRTFVAPTKTGIYHEVLKPGGYRPIGAVFTQNTMSVKKK